MPTVTVIEPGGPADAAGVKLGDTIWQVDGMDIQGLQVDCRELLINNNPEVRLSVQAESIFSGSGWGIPSIGSLRIAPQRRNVVLKRRFAAGGKEPLLSPNAMVARDKGRALFKEGQYEGAAAAFTEAISGSPNAYTLLTNRALCNQKLGKWDLVEADAREALKQSNASVKAHYLLGKALLELGRCEDAKAAFLSSMSHSSSPEFKSYRGSIDVGLLAAQKKCWEKGESVKEANDQALREILTKMAEDCAAAAAAQGEDGVENLLQKRSAAIDRMLKRVRVQREADKVPPALVCKLTRKIMTDPVVTPRGTSYEREPLDKHLQTSAFDPLHPTEKLTMAQVTPNLALKKSIDAFLEQHPWAFDQEFG